MNRSRTSAVFGVLFGLLAVVLAVVMFAAANSDSGVSGMSSGTYTSYNYYGGDAYTGIQQAAADTARNVQSQSAIIRAGFEMLSGKIPGLGTVPGSAALLLFAGLAMICHFSRALNEIKARDAFESAVLKKLSQIGDDRSQAE